MTLHRFGMSVIAGALLLAFFSGRAEGQAADAAARGDPTRRVAAQVVVIPRQANSVSTELTGEDAMSPDGRTYDEFAYPVHAGQRVVIEMASDAFNTVLRVGRGRGGAWREIAHDDDGGEGTNSRLELRSEESGELVIRAGALTRAGRGEYTLRFPLRGQSAPLPAWEGAWVLDSSARGGGPPEWLRFRSDGTGEYESRYWSGPARFTYASTGEDRISITGLPRGWTASAQRFLRGTIQLSVDRGNGSQGLLPFNRAGGTAEAAPQAAAKVARPVAQENPFVGLWRESANNSGETLEISADGRAVLNVPGHGGGTYPMRYSRSGTGATLTGYPRASATMRVSETGTLFINFVSNKGDGSRGMAMYRRASP